MNPFPGSVDCQETPQETTQREQRIRDGKTTRAALDFQIVTTLPVIQWPSILSKRMKENQDV